MHKSGVEAMSPALDDIRPLPPNRFAANNLGPLERYSSLFGGTALLIGGIRRGRLSMIMGGGVLLYRGATGFCPIYGALNGDPKHGTQIEKSITVHKPVEEVYRRWRHIENLPRFMSHLKSVTSANEHQSHWVANTPLHFLSGSNGTPRLLTTRKIEKSLGARFRAQAYIIQVRFCFILYRRETGLKSNS